MLEDADRLESAPRRPGAPLLRVVPVDRRVIFAVPRTNTRRGTPRSSEEWTALVKVGSGETNIPVRQCERLRTLGLVVTVSGKPALTRHGRFTLGLPA